MRVLALDFDGVVSNSAAESFVVAARTHAALRPGSDWARALVEGLAGDRAPPLEQVRRAPAFAAFLEAMPLGNRAEDYGVVLAALEAGRPLPDQAAYDAWRARQDPAWLERFHERFYRERWALEEADPAGWRALMAPYAPLLRVLRRRQGDARLAVATAKDRRSVEALLDEYGARDLFSDDAVFDKETGTRKTAHLRAIARQFGAPLAEITFVDDKLNHLERVAPLGVRCVLAAWGFNGPRERDLARERGFPVCALDAAERLLFT